MDCKAEEMARNETNSVPTLVQNHLQAQKQNNKMIQDSLNEQEARIRERLELRRVTSFQKCRTGSHPKHIAETTQACQHSW